MTALTMLDSHAAGMLAFGRVEFDPIAPYATGIRPRPSIRAEATNGMAIEIAIRSWLCAARTAKELC
jgi:hypothetical protein